MSDRWLLTVQTEDLRVLKSMPVTRNVVSDVHPVLWLAEARREHHNHMSVVLLFALRIPYDASEEDVAGLT